MDAYQIVANYDDGRSSLIHEISDVGDLQSYLYTEYDQLLDFVRNYGCKIALKYNGKDVDSWEYFEEKACIDSINLSDEEFEKERIKRIKALNLETTAEKDMIKNKTFWVSERMGLPWNVNYFLDGYSYEKEIRRCIDVLKNIHVTPYFATVDHLRGGGLLISILCISRRTVDWERERIDRNGVVDAWVFNTELGDIPDYGAIQVKFSMGAVRRIA